MLDGLNIENLPLKNGGSFGNNMITDGKTITEDVSLNPMWSVIKTYGSEEDKEKYKDLHKVTVTPNKEDWQKWYAHTSNKDHWIEEQENEYDL